MTSCDLQSANPATGETIGSTPSTPEDAVRRAVADAKRAQVAWADTPWRDRKPILRRFWSILARDAESWADAIRREIGKPFGEAMGEVVSSLDAVRWTVKKASRALADEQIRPGWQRALLIPSARLRWRPYGIIGIIGTWNYPLFLNAPAIAQALAAGNGVVWKPSELALLVGRKLQQSLDEAGVPAGLVSAVYGGGEVGQALLEAGIDKGAFTGGVENGRRVLAALGTQGIPAIAELSGFDPAIVLPDAPLEPTVRALTWSAFVGAGQTCIAVKRVYVVGSAERWAEALADSARALRVGDPASNAVDVGPMISESARSRFDQTIRETVTAGARVLAGGAPQSGRGWFYPPTVLLAESPAPEARLAGCFGPVVIVRAVPDIDAAVDAANSAGYGLAASVWGRDRPLAKSVAAKICAGMVAVNDAVTTSAHAAAPFGGTGRSGFGRVRGVIGLREFAQPQVTHVRGPGGFRPHLYPYSDRLRQILSVYRRFFHRP